MSMLALRPADAAETSVAWKMAMENTHTPTALVLSRQNINDLPSDRDRYEEALQAEKEHTSSLKTATIRMLF